MDLLAFPCELLLQISENLDVSRDVSSLLRTNRYLADVLLPVLRDFALSDPYLRITALCWSVALGHKPMVKLLLEKGGLLVVSDIHGALLHQGPAGCTNEVLERVLQWGPNIVIKTPYLIDWPLGWAILTRHNALCKLLLEKGADVDFYIKGRTPPLYLTIDAGDEATLKLLLEYGVDPNSTRGLRLTLL